MRLFLSRWPFPLQANCVLVAPWAFYQDGNSIQNVLYDICCATSRCLTSSDALTDHGKLIDSCCVRVMVQQKTKIWGFSMDEVLKSKKVDVVAEVASSLGARMYLNFILDYMVKEIQREEIKQEAFQELAWLGSLYCYHYCRTHHWYRTRRLMVKFSDYSLMNWSSSVNHAARFHRLWRLNCSVSSQEPSFYTRFQKFGLWGTCLPAIGDANTIRRYVHWIYSKSVSWGMPHSKTNRMIFLRECVLIVQQIKRLLTSLFCCMYTHHPEIVCAF